MSAYNVDTLMDETRRVAALYRANTGQTLPVGSELAKYDASKYLPLIPPSTVEKNVDFIGQEGLKDNKILLKSRVIFDERKSNYRLGKINLADSWDKLVLVLYSDDYNPKEIFIASKKELYSLFDKPPKGQVEMSLAKYRNVASSIWCGE
jgi:hypothetical protein